MAIQDINTLKGKFADDKEPNGADFGDFMDSFYHKSSRIAQHNVLGLNDALNEKADLADLANATINFKGYHTDLSKLQAAYPQAQNRKDFFAWVGSPYPGTVYKVFADSGAWTDTGEVPTQQEIDLAEYLKKDTVTEEITNEKETIPSNFAVNGLQLKLYGGVGGGTGVSELIPYASDTNTNLLSATSCCYETQTAYIGKSISYLRVKMGVAGTFTVYSSTARNDLSKARWKKSFNVILGENKLTIGETVNQGEYLCFASSTDTSRFAFNSSRKNAIGGGLYYDGSYYGQDLCIGIYAGSNIEEVDGDIPKLWAKIEEIENGGTGGGETVEEVIPYDGSGTTKPTDKTKWIRYNNQALFQGETINKIAVNVDTAGKFRIFSGDASGAAKSWDMLVDVVAGKNEIEINKKVPETEYLYFSGAGNTVNYLYNGNNGAGSSDAGGGFTYQGHGSFTQKLCIGIWIGGSTGGGGGTQPPVTPEPELTRIEKWRKMEADICKYYAIPCLDITYTNGITSFSMGKLMPDGVHPNTEGHKFLATAIYPTFSGLASILSNGDPYYSLGDSITAGYGGATSYAHYLATATGLTRTNRAISGNTIIGNDFYNQIAGIPDNFAGAVTIMIGVNDYNRGHAMGDAAAVLAKPFAELNRNASSAESFRFGLETLLRKAPSCKILVIVPFFTTW